MVVSRNFICDDQLTGFQRFCVFADGSQTQFDTCDSRRSIFHWKSRRLENPLCFLIIGNIPNARDGSKSLHALYSRALCGWSMSQIWPRGEKICSWKEISDGRKGGRTDRLITIERPQSGGGGLIKTEEKQLVFSTKSRKPYWSGTNTMFQNIYCTKKTLDQMNIG